MNLLPGLGADRLADFWSIVREIDPRSIEREALKPVKIVVCGAEDAGHRLLAAEMAIGAADDSIVDVLDMPADVPIALPPADAYVYVARESMVDSRTVQGHLWQLNKRNGVVICAVSRAESHDRAAARAPDVSGSVGPSVSPDRIVWLRIGDRRAVQTDLATRIAEHLPHLALAIGRNLPSLREGAATQLIRETARVNAEFTGVSSLPGLVPFVGTIASAGADMVVLTKNQVMLLVKLALVHRRATDDRWQLLTEISPVIGAAFFWRWAARSLISLIPGPFAIAPKVGIAYVGTFVIGRIADYYYLQGRRPPPELIEAFTREATAQFGALRPLIGRIGRRLPPI